jgi:AcrR family transcriptional regulator
MANAVAATGKWKEREKEIRGESRKNREAIMLDYAREISNKKGFNGLSLPQLAEISGFSKPTIYKYFPNKEDLMAALVVESSSVSIEHYQKVLTFAGRPREKIYAIHSLNYGFLNWHFRDWLYIFTEKIQKKAAASRQQELDQNNKLIFDIHASIIREAIEAGDLKLPEKVDEYQFFFSLISTTIGGCVLKESESEVIQEWFEKIKFMHGTFGRIVLDGIGWRPLTSEWDYDKSLKRFYREIFPELDKGTEGSL